MPINPDLLIAAPMLQDAFVDKDGTPMSNGVVTCYQDNSRTTLKNWYYQSGTPGNYTYIPLPNPLTLSAAGTICDINGVDTIPFFYPYSELDETVSQPYFITIVNQFGTNQITRANFPFNRAAGGGNVTEIENVQNLIVNNGFWRNLQPNYINSLSLTSIALNTLAVDGSVSVVVAPSQHDGYTMSDILFLKNNTTGTDELTFTPFPASTSPVIVQGGVTYTTPEYYINHTCSAVGTGETEKCYQFPIALHLNNLANIPYSVSIQAQSVSGANVIQLNILQYAGSGVSSPNPMLIGGTTITLDTDWTNYTLTDIFPSIVGLTLSQGEDDAFYLQVQMPFNAACSINFTKPAIYLTTNALPVNDFQTYDEVNSIISSPRTGDVRMAQNSFYNFGWLPMNNGLFGLTNPGTNVSYVRANADTWPLFNLLWTAGKIYDSGSNFNPMFQMFSNTAGTITPTNYGTTAYGDFVATLPSLALSLPYSMGRVMMGTVPLSALLPGVSGFTGYKIAVTASNGSPNLVFTYAPASVFNIFQGAPIVFTGTLPNAIVANAVYFVITIPGSTTTFNIATTFANALAGTAIAYNSTSGTGITAFLYPAGNIEGEYGHLDLLNEMVNHTHDPLSPLSSYVGQGGSSVAGVGSSLGHTATTGTVSNYGTQVPFNVTQPGTFTNVFIKL
jgi:hypothetical protein